MNNPIIKKLGETNTETGRMLWFLDSKGTKYGITPDYDINTLMICDENDNCDNCDCVDDKSIARYQNIVDSIKFINIHVPQSWVNDSSGWLRTMHNNTDGSQLKEAL